jgi:hypothetical protein
MDTFKKYSGYVFLIIILIVFIVLGVISTLMYTSVEPVPNAFLDSNGNVISGIPNYAWQLKLYAVISAIISFVASVGIIAYFLCLAFSGTRVPSS